MSVGPRPEILNIVSNDYGPTKNVYDLDRKYPLRANLVQKKKQKKENCQFKLKFGTYNYVHNILRLFDG